MDNHDTLVDRLLEVKKSDMYLWSSVDFDCLTESDIRYLLDNPDMADIFINAVNMDFDDIVDNPDIPAKVRKMVIGE